MLDPYLLENRHWSPRCPPERFHVFLSYTTREEEVQVVKPIIDNFLVRILRPIIEQTIGEPPVFYDGYWLYSRMGTTIPNFELEQALRFAIEESEILIAFISPEYFGSEWCRFECNTMGSKVLRPWFDICRKPPIPELEDQRSPAWRPSRLECNRARFLMWQWERSKKPFKRGGALVPVLWKGEVDRPLEMSEMEGLRLFDWRPCIPAFMTRLQVAKHLLRHGSVSPSWSTEAEDLGEKCEESMRATADAIVMILLQRRLFYARSK